MRSMLILSFLACVHVLDVYSVGVHPPTLGSTPQFSTMSETRQKATSFEASFAFVTNLASLRCFNPGAPTKAAINKRVFWFSERRAVRSAASFGLRMARDSKDESSDENEEYAQEVDSSLSFYRSDNGTRDSEFRFSNRKREPNPYRDMMESFTPGEMVGQFMAKASPEVQGAVKNTIIGLLGSLRASPAFEASISTTHRALASLMFQLEMTGYMFRNAEYRQALQRSLSAALETVVEEEESEEEEEEGRTYPTVRGRISVSFGEESEEVEVDAESYVSELSKEVEALKQEIASLKQEKEKESAKDLLTYVQSMEHSEMQGLTASVSPQVLEAMKQLVDTVIRGMGSDQESMDETTEVPASTLAQLCMWQLVVGYNLREMEARESMKNRLLEPEGGADPP